MTTCYVDTSVLLHVLARDDGAMAYRWFTGLDPDDRLVASVLVRLETIRAFVRDRTDPGLAEPFLRHLALIPVGPAVLRVAERVPGPLRTLDAIHLATALQGPDTVMVTHDIRLGEISRGAGLSVFDPVGVPAGPSS